MSKIIKNLFFVVMLILVLVWLFAVIKCEADTYKFKAELPKTYYDVYGEETYNKVKVLYINNCYACVYAKNNDYGNLYHLMKKCDEDKTMWEEFDWECVWSRSGSADGFVWPYGR